MSGFPKVSLILKRLDEAGISYAIGGSVALYAQGHSRQPHDVDVMFVNEAHSQANKLFGLKSEIIERRNVTMHKSTPVDDGTLDFLSHYTLIADGEAHHHPPVQKVPVEFEGRRVNLIPAEKIIAIKLIGRRQHHHDLDDVAHMINHPDFDRNMFWEMVGLLGARETVQKILKDNNINI